MNSTGFAKDIAGKRFGKLTAIVILATDQAKALGLRNGAHWICKCDCGRTRIAFGGYLRREKVMACDVCARDAVRQRRSGPRQGIDVTGKKFGMLTALRRDLNVISIGQGSVWIFSCDCGREVSLRLKDVRYGNTLSCGCLKNASGFRYGEPKLDHARPWRAEAEVTQ